MLKRITLLVCLLGLVFAPGAATPARAGQGQPRQAGWEPGVYTGWVYVSARLSKNHTINQQGATLRQDTVVYWQAHGDLSVSATSGDQGRVSVYLPFEITGQENGFFTMPNASCQFNFLGLGQSVIQDLTTLVDQSIDGAGFRAALVVPGASARVGRSSATGQCGSIQQTALFINDTLKNTTSKISAITFQVGYTSPLSVGGTCELEDWAQNVPLSNGSLTREMLECTWRVFREPQGAQQ